MNNIIVVFTDNNARILKNPDNIDQYRNHPNALINPDLSGVIRVPPHLWKLHNGKISTMTELESTIREEHINIYGCNNDHTSIFKLTAIPVSTTYVPVIRLSILVRLKNWLVSIIKRLIC